MIGREEEIKELKRLYHRNRTELVAVYGRLRVGKTYLVDETFQGKFTFRHTGLSPADMETQGQLRSQLDHFYNSLILAGMEKKKKPDNWLDAFFLLELFLQSIDDGSRMLVFLDELPWMDTPRSSFVQAFEGFWNNWACHRDNLMVIVCGSDESWMMDNLINSHGGLYDRITWSIKLVPWTLHECERFFRENKIRFSRYDIVQSYMIFGGIPYYLRLFDGQYSLAQNVDRILFSREAKLKKEFERLFRSVFVSPDAEKAIVAFLATRGAGYTRKEIAEGSGVSGGGTLSRHLDALIAGNFVETYVPFGMGKREEHYKVVDPLCLFCLHFASEIQSSAESFWQEHGMAQPVVTWREQAFEQVCFHHIPQIKKALGVSGVITSVSAWTMREDDPDGTQISLLLKRNDNVLNMCEMKFCGGRFTVHQDDYRTLLGRPELLRQKVSPRIVVRSTLITTFGLTRNAYSGVFTNVITLNDLFEK
ncbi:MAG: ATP-binding protein [Clostridia bacterium]|nr:ATP-binding protein [Clostridia bacterium]